MIPGQFPLTNEFVKLIKTISDDRNGIYKTIDFLSFVLKYKASTPPSTEFVTVLKHKKPMMFHHLKRAVSPTSPLQYMLQLEMDYTLALERLGLQEQDF